MYVLSLFMEMFYLLKYFFASCCVFYSIFHMLHAQTPSSTSEYHVDVFKVRLSPSLHLTTLKLQDAVLCRCATETMHEIYWPRVPTFDTQDVANRSCAISQLLRLPCKADLSCLQAIFKP